MRQGLSEATCRSARAQEKAYRLSDGAGLFLCVSPGGTKTWRLFYRKGERVVGHTIGRYPDPVGLAAARAERDRLKGMRAEGLDPEAQRTIAAEQERAALAQIERNRASTFDATADAWIEANGGTWTPRHRAQVVQCLRDHIRPILGAQAVASIRPADVLEALAPLINAGKAETARRAYQRISGALEFAALHGLAEFNAAASCKREVGRRLKGALRQKPRAHFACVSMRDAPALMRAIRALQSDTTAKALALFVAMTACRTGEARAATWDEIDFEAKRWTIPAKRMKARRAHYFDLAPEVIKLLKDQRERIPPRCLYVFPHPTRIDRHASENAVLAVIAAAGYAKRMSGHGFRALLSTAANESGKHRREVIEAHLAHITGNAVERAYNRASFAQERKALALWWAKSVAKWA